MIPTSGDIPIVGDVRLRGTLRLTGHAAMSGGGTLAWADDVTPAPFTPLVHVPAGIRLHARGIALRNREWKSATEWTCTRAMLVDGDATLDRVDVREGLGVEVPTGALVWRGGGATGLQRYLVKCGDADNDPKIVARRAELYGLVCDGTTTEAVVRAQGCDRMILANCVLLQKDAVGRHDKGALALRLVRGCTITGGEFDTLELGWRTPSSVGESDERYGAANPNFIFIGRSTINGSVRNCGNSAVAVQSCRFTGLDRRGFGEKTAMIEQTHKTWRGEIMHDSCTIPNGWKIGDGVQKKSENPKRWMQIWANANAD